jgi:predicted  nucleic acid-binding Zn-ribbon protein
MTAPTIETDLGKILDQINQNLAEFRKETNQRFEQLNKDITEIKVGQAKLEAEVSALKEDVKEIKGSQMAQIWSLIGILGTVALGAVVRFVIAAMPAGNP